MINMSDDSDINFSDNDIDEKKHAKIIENVLSLNKSQHLKKPSRTEPTLHISEFNLVKSVTGKQGSVQIDDLAKVLKTRKKHAQIGKKVEATKKKTRTLPKPLEKPKSDRIRRTVGYEKSRYLFDRWEAFVTANRAQAHQVFPLDSIDKLSIETKQANGIGFGTLRYKSNLMKELEKVDAELEEYHIEDENDKDEFPLTLQELKEKRKEAAKLRAHQSYKEAKSRRQNKIKSKKYHRILRKEKIKQKLKEFEELQKTNPDEALKKLGEIEKARALERFSLRHKGTGQWAKSKQVRAKYDKEARKILAEQLQISRDLTQKQKHLDSDSEDEGIESEKVSDSCTPSTDNPWIGGPKPDKEVTEFVSSYKKFWNDQNKNSQNGQCSENIEKEPTQNYVDNNSDGENDKVNDKNTSLKESNTINSSKALNKKQTKNAKRKKSDTDADTMRTSIKKKKDSSGNWDIEEIFDNAEKKVEEKLKKKLLKNQKGKKMKKTAKDVETKKKQIKQNANKKIDLTIPSQSKKQIIDEEMIERPTNDKDNPETNVNIAALKNILDNESNVSNKTGSKQVGCSNDIDPEKFMKPNITNLNSALPDVIIENENEEESIQKNIILEAFEDNDIVDDFTKEKLEELQKDKPENIDLNLPGWGSWAGTGINPKKQRKRRRFIVKMPEVMPRRDDNKGSLIINEKAAAKIKPHLVSEVPFPFKTVKDFEASIRAPIGNTFVPELAYRRYITPAVETKMGAIIEPVTTSILMGKPKKK